MASLSTIQMLDTIKMGSSDGFDPKMQALLHIARTVRRDAARADRPTRRRPAPRVRPTPTCSSPCSSRRPSRCTTAWSTASARETPPNVEIYRERADEIAENGYSDRIRRLLPVAEANVPG